MKHPIQLRQPPAHRLMAAAVLAVVSVPCLLAQNTGTVNFTTQLQPIVGFGVANPFGRGDYLVQSPAIQSQVIDQLFNPYTGAGLTMLRIGLDTDTVIEPNSPGSPSSPPDYVWDGMDGGQVWVAQQAVKYGVKRFYADSWGAPGFMKTNNNIDSGGAICGGPSASCATGDWRQAYADYLIQFVKNYQQAGVPISDLSFVNEPDITQTYTSMTLSTAQVTDFLHVFGPAVQSSGINVNLNCCDLSNWSRARTYTSAVVADPVADQYIHSYTGHEYGALATTPLPTTKPTWMSEWGPQSPRAYNSSWDEVQNGTSANSNNGMYVANDISNALSKGGVSAYIWWYAASTGATGAMIQLGATSDATSYVVTKRLFALGTFARFVHPGAYFVPATSTDTNLNITAFINPDGTRVMNIVNNDTAVDTVSFTLDASTANWVPASYVTDENDSIAPTNAATVSGQTLVATLAPRSLTSITLSPPVVAGVVQLVVTPTLQQQGDGSYLASVKVSNVGTGTAQNVQLSSASLGSVAGSTLPAAPLPFTIGNIAPGSFAVFAVNFPAGEESGTLVIEKYAGTYSNGTGNGTFGGSLRAVLPSLP